jgi:hypothetical protein
MGVDIPMEYGNIVNSQIYIVQFGDFHDKVSNILFQQLDNLVFNNIYEHLKHGLFIKDEMVGALTQKLIVIG